MFLACRVTKVVQRIRIQAEMLKQFYDKNEKPLKIRALIFAMLHYPVALYKSCLNYAR